MTEIKVSPARRRRVASIWKNPLLMTWIPLLFTVDAFQFPTFSSRHINTRQMKSQSQSTSLSMSESPREMNVAVVGGGPAGLLLSHLLLKNNQSRNKETTTKITVFESRKDPRLLTTESQAYALGIGIRGRTAIRQVDEELWESVKAVGYESERFQLHVGRFVIPLRSEADGKRSENTKSVEPSLLLFQSSLCQALAEALSRRHGASGNLKLVFNQKVETCDFDSMKLTTKVPDGDSINEFGPFDLVIGSDGVNSVVRDAIQKAFPSFGSVKEQLPGEFKVVRLEKPVGGKVDPKAVSLILPTKGSVTAFVEPTDNDGECCILFAGRGETPILSNTSNRTLMMETLTEAFPQWQEFHEEIADQLMNKATTGSASSVRCNTYNYGGKAALIGDACHATGGVSGQGVNSALCDSVALAESIQKHSNDLPRALLEYSKRQVPEGKALYDLSFGPKPTGFKKLKWSLRTVRDTLFRGKLGIGRPPLQTRLTTNLVPFSTIRREVDKYYDYPFPEDSKIHQQLEELNDKATGL